MTLIVVAVGLILTVFSLLQQIAFWQRKEYRLDRLWADVSQRARQPKWQLGVGAALAVALVGIVFSSAILGWLGLVIVAVQYAHQLLTRGIVKPHVTTKAIVIGLLSLLLVGVTAIGLFMLPLPQSLVWYLLLLSTIACVAVAVAAGNGAGEIQKRALISRVAAQRQHLASLRVIGITGSFGKTSTKYFVHHLLSGSRTKVVMSEHRRNEAFAVAQDMSKNVTADVDVYIVEMGAYQRGEIARLARLAKPSIGVVTAISNQHVALFGSRDALAAAKWELIEGLPSDGVAVLNADNEIIQEKAKVYTGRIVWYSTQDKEEVWADSISHQPTNSSFMLHIKDTQRLVTIPLPGEGYVDAAVAAAATAYAAGLAPVVIFERLASLPVVPQTMTVTKNSQGALILDDSYSANEAGVLMALRHLKRFEQPRKVVVLRPLIELGAETERVHTVVGQALSKVATDIFLYDTPGAADIETAAVAAGFAGKLQRIASPKKLSELLRQTLDESTVCLLENRLPDIVRTSVLA